MKLYLVGTYIILQVGKSALSKMPIIAIITHSYIKNQ